MYYRENTRSSLTNISYFIIAGFLLETGTVPHFKYMIFTLYWYTKTSVFLLSGRGSYKKFENAKINTLLACSQMFAKTIWYFILKNILRTYWRLTYGPKNFISYTTETKKKQVFSSFVSETLPLVLRTKTSFEGAQQG